MSLTLRALDDAVHAWIVAATALPARQVVFVQQNAPHVTARPLVTIQTGPHVYDDHHTQGPIEETLSREDVLAQSNNGADETASLGSWIPLWRHRETTVALQAFGDGAGDLLTAISDSIGRPTFRPRFQDWDFSAIDDGPAQDLTGLIGSSKQWETRAGLSLRVRSIAAVDDDPGLIETVRATPTYARGHGDPAPAVLPQITFGD